MEYFGDLIKFVKSHICKLNQTIIPLDAIVVSCYPQEYAEMTPFVFLAEDLISYTEAPNIADVEPVVKSFAMKWKSALELMHNEVVTCCSNLVSGMAILKAAMAQLLNDYNRLSECVKMIPGGSSLNRNLVSITTISYEIRKYSRTL
jgi:hypothetical protein